MTQQMEFPRDGGEEEGKPFEDVQVPDEENPEEKAGDPDDDKTDVATDEDGDSLDVRGMGQETDRSA
jgi:hypothetical protein